MENPKKRILCVEDDEDTCLMITLLLSDYEVITVGTLSEAVQLIGKELFDLYLLDNWLGGDSGIQLCQYIQTADPNTPVIFCSGVAYERDREEALKAGAQEYLFKPVEPPALQSVVLQQIKKSEWQSLEAKVAEMSAIRDVIEEHVSIAEDILNDLKKKAAKEKAFQAFLAAGGNRAHFERLWPEALQEVAQTAR